MHPGELLAAYEKLLARALEYARGMGDFVPTRTDEDSRWLSQLDGAIRVHWLGDDEDGLLEERSLPVPLAAFDVPAEEFPAWVLEKRIERAERLEANWPVFQELARQFFKDNP